MSLRLSFYELLTLCQQYAAMYYYVRSFQKGKTKTRNTSKVQQNVIVFNLSELSVLTLDSSGGKNPKKIQLAEIFVNKLILCSS